VVLSRLAANFDQIVPELETAMEERDFQRLPLRPARLGVSATILLSAVLCTLVHAANTKRSQPSLTVGSVELRLGMTKAELDSILPQTYFLFGSSRYGPSEKQGIKDAPNGELLALCEHGLGHRTDCHGGIEFKADRLVFAKREWNVQTPETVDTILAAVVNGIQSVSEGNRGLTSRDGKPLSTCEIRVKRSPSQIVTKAGS